MFTQFRPDYFFLFSMKQRAELFFQLWVARLFILFYLQTLPDPPFPAELICCPQNKPGNNRTKLWNGWCQNNGDMLWKNKSYFWHFISCWFFIFFSDNSNCFHRNGFEMYILIIIYTVCTCLTLVPTRILNSEISWFCFDFPKWGPVSFIITDLTVFVQFFE